jgi:hypothetical protein
MEVTLTVANCDTCGNEYENAFEVRTADGNQYHFDSLECAAHKLAPTCAHCGCRILGHGVRTELRTFCCAHCAHASSDRQGGQAKDAVTG